MVFEKFKEKTKQFKAASDHVKDVSFDQVNQLLDDFNKTVPTIKSLGLSMKKFHMGMGVIPEIEITLSGSVNAIDIKKIQELIQNNPDKKIKALAEDMKPAGYFIKPVDFESLKLAIDDAI